MEISKRNIVKVCSYIKEDSKIIEGSGVIINQPENTEYLYVITALHCIYYYNDEEKRRYNRKDIEKITCKYKYDDKGDFSNEIVVLDWIDNQDIDIALLKLPRNELLSQIPENKIENIIILDDCLDGEHLISSGYTNVSSEEVENISSTCERKDKSNPSFRIETNIPLTTYTGESSQSVIRGFSGSGIFIKNTNKLIGIITENPKSTGAKILRGVRLKELPALISKYNNDNWEQIKIESIVDNKKNVLSMDHFINLDEEDLTRLKNIIFKSISEQKVVLLIGPNIHCENNNENLFDKIFSTYCLEKEISNYEEFKDVVDFADNIFLDQKYSRDDFDDYISSYFNKIQILDVVDDLAAINWREVLSFTPDTKFESSYEKNSNVQNIKTILSKEEYFGGISANQVKYVKLSGALNNRDYPPVISSEDFKKNNTFYKTVLNHFRSTTPNIIWLAIGFPINDAYSDRIINVLSQDLKAQGKQLYLIDQSINKYRLPKLKEQNISVINIDNRSFLNHYLSYYEVNKELILKRKKIDFRNKDKKTIALSYDTKYVLGNTIKQIDSYMQDVYIDAKDFYKGEEPSYHVIRKNFDTQRTEIQKEAIKAIIQSFKNGTENLNEVPIFLVTGDYGIGKSTTTLRIINELIAYCELDILAFEILDTDKVDINALLKLFKKSNCNNYLLFVNYIEQDSAFKSLFSFKNKLSNQDLSDIDIVILSSIRINILKKHINDKRFLNNYQEININKPLCKDEIDDLLSKLNNTNLIGIRDARSKEKIKNDIIEKYNGDILTTLMYLIKDSRHESFIEKAFKELSPEIQDAFKYTSLLYRFKIPMPASILKDLVTKNWNAFIEKVIKGDGYNILIQIEPSFSQSSEPDLLFRTRHSDISEKLIINLVRSKDKLFELYKLVLSKFTEGYSMAKLIINILKALERSETFTNHKVSELYKIGAKTFNNNSHFNLFYANNLMRKRDIVSLELANDNLAKVYYTENESGHKNHRIIHKRGEVCFVLAKYYNKEKDDLQMNKYLEDAEEFFEQKRILDPLSAFSYNSYIRMKIWEIETFEYEDKNQELEVLNKIEDLFDDAEKYVLDQEWIKEERERFNHLFKDDYFEEYFQDNDEILKDSPQYLVLKYYYYVRTGEINNADEIIYLLENSKELNYVAKLLFKHYGRNLYDKVNREKLSDLIRNNNNIRDTNPLRFNYYKYINAVYDYRWGKYFETIKKIRQNYENLNPRVYEEWKNTDGSIKHFTGTIKSGENKKFIRILEFSKNFPLVKGNYSNAPIGSHYKVELLFYLTGIRVKLINKID